MITWSLAAAIATLKAYLPLAGGVVAFVLALLLRRKDGQLQAAKNETKKLQFNAEIQPLQERANAITQEIEKDDAKAKAAEEKMREILNRTGAPGAGPDCKSR